MARKIYMPTQQEDAAITAAANADPDALPLTDAELASAARLDPKVIIELTLAEAQALAHAAEIGAVDEMNNHSAYQRADQKLHRAIAAATKPN
jgi:hypothetical protein